MTILDRWLGATRTVTVLSGALIALALLYSWTVGSAADFPLDRLLMIVATFVAGVPIALKAYRALRTRLASIDLLVTVAAAGALGIGEVWEAAAVTFLFALGNALEGATLDRTRSALAELIKVAPETALVLRGGEQVEVGAAEVRVGETVLVKNGARVPVDGEVIGGTGSV